MATPKKPTCTVPCYICGADAGQGGWIQGFIPSSSTLKMGLCREHDTPENRQVVTAAWQDLLQREIVRMATLDEHKATPSQLWRLEIAFVDGGSLHLESLGCTSAQDTLQVILPDKSLRFFPLVHIRQYALRPLSPDAAAIPASMKANALPSNPDSGRTDA